MIRAIGDNIVELSIIALVTVFFIGIGFLIFLTDRDMTAKYEQCIKAEMQWVEGSCVR
jgi:hypothetical protein